VRIISALKADVRFQFKQGFYLVYILLTLIYMVILGKLPSTWKSTVIPLVLFSDPSMVGFFFIGALVMLEKVQGVIQYVVVTPLRSIEYLLAKVLSLTILAVAATIMITLATYGYELNWFLLILGVLLTSCFFVFYGFIVAVRCTTLNQYFIKMVPYLLLIVLPCFSLIGFPYAWLFNIFPSVAGLKLVYGAFNGIDSISAAALSIYLLAANLAIARYVEKVFDRMATEGA
jgi:fluoroquinolone transport system permease protein